MSPGTPRNPFARKLRGPDAFHPRRPVKLLLLAAAIAFAAILSPSLWAAHGSDLISDSIHHAIIASAATLGAVGWALAIPLAILELAGAGIAKLRGSKTETIPPYFFAIRGAWFLFIFANLTLPPEHSFANGILTGAQSLVTSMTGLAGFNPVQILKNGYALYLDYTQVTFVHGILAFFDGNGLPTFVAHQLTGLLVLLAYALVALVTSFLLVQSALTVALAPIFTALGASRWTAQYFDLYVSYLIFLTVKTILLALVLSAGELITHWFGQVFRILANHALDTATFLASDLPLYTVLPAAAYALASLTPGPLAMKLAGKGFRFTETLLRNES